MTVEEVSELLARWRCAHPGPFQGEPNPPPAHPGYPVSSAPPRPPLSAEDEAIHRAISRSRSNEPHGPRMGAAQWIGDGQ